MRTHALLAVLVLLALQAQNGSLPENAEEAPGQEQSGEEDQDKTIFFIMTETSALQDEHLGRGWICNCREGVCPLPEHNSGVCTIGIRWHTLCCH
jgi:hypothetical protein|uniref:Mammalian defensins domain-containing protein n=1 Tax=Castor canadensis TaxID=51338 RepID=A0A8C0WIK5_CASCN